MGADTTTRSQGKVDLMPHVIVSSKQSQQADAPMLLAERSTEEFGGDASPARLIERIIVEYARAWRGARPRVEDPVASGTC